MDEDIIDIVGKTTELVMVNESLSQQILLFEMIGDFINLT